MTGAQGECELARGECTGRELPGSRTVVVGQPSELPAEIVDVRAEVARRRSAAVIENRAVADQMPPDVPDPAGLKLAGELCGGGTVPALPRAIEAAVAEGRIAAANQVQISVPYTEGSEVAGAHDLRLKPRSRPEVSQDGDRGVELLHRGRRTGDACAQGEQRRPIAQVVHRAAGARAGVGELFVQRGSQRDGSAGQRAPRRGRRPCDGGGAAVGDSRVGRKSLTASPTPRKDRGERHNSYAACNSSAVCGPTHAIDSSSGIPRAISATSASVTLSSSSMILSGSGCSPCRIVC